MDYNKYTDEQKKIIEEVFDTLIKDNSISSDGKKRRKIKISRKDIQVAFFMKNEIELGKEFGLADIEDIAKLVKNLSCSNNTEDIDKLKAEREELQKKAAELTKKITALKLKKGGSNIIIE